MITLALAGKPNCGKSTFFRAATMAHAEIANYPFTTIDANFGVAYIRTACPCRGLDLQCGNCTDGVRFVPVNLIDVAGLVPEAHKGRGLGNQFLDNLRQADAIIHIVDASGATDSEGNPVDIGSHNPLGDIEFLGFEMTMWIYGILDKHWAKLQRQAQSKTYSLYNGVSDVLTGLGISPEEVRDAEVSAGIELSHAGEQELIMFCREIMKISKPMVPVANKADQAPPAMLEKLVAGGAIPASAAGELALRNAAAANLIRYLPGDPVFSVANEGALTPPQKAGLAKISEYMAKFKGTGVQQAINYTVHTLLDMIVVYPVEDEHKFSDSRGRVLPDAFLMKKGSTPRDLAFQVHTDIGERFLYAVDARTKMRIKDTYELREGDIVRIVSAAK
ncbi:ribosome-binding ATPase YchF (GTP1/OBG family) [Methanolinea mesophila]|uniref:redox-regulated ATPase YchF n=1 Tax=Methanolinea mesophila TaxID=547055 RepID=UPI001AE699C9|nr:redox-regulated ATPase YchF [Methanolinea mesophila]MBP1929694.1 ribosome-binding ATPase YchF (GTP1/OBG family) [Methanolinea mesophila]